MLRVQVKHVDYDADEIWLPAEITKAGRDQLVHVGTERSRQILEERRSLGPETFIFGREDGSFVASFAKVWRKLFRLAGLEVGRKAFIWHDLRHEYGSRLIEVGATIQETKELMRHSDIRTTQRYLKAGDARLKELARHLERGA